MKILLKTKELKDLSKCFKVVLRRWLYQARTNMLHVPRQQDQPTAGKNAQQSQQQTSQQQVSQQQRSRITSTKRL
jgi:hypothetical protein